MTIERKCAGCGSMNMEPGKIQSTGQVYFRPENTKFFTLGTNDVKINGNICTDCGTIQLVGDLRKVDKLVDKSKPH